MVRPNAAAAVLATLAVLGCNAAGKICTAMGCMNGASIAVPVETAFSNIVGSTLDICRNDVCISGTYGDASEPTTGSSSVSISFPDAATRGATDPWATATVWRTATGYRIDVYYNVYGPNDAVDGDRYHVRLVSASGDLLAEAEKTVNYQSFYPNGPDCDAVPCRHVGITF